MFPLIYLGYLPRYEAILEERNVSSITRFYHGVSLSLVARPFTPRNRFITARMHSECFFHREFLHAR